MMFFLILWVLTCCKNEENKNRIEIKLALQKNGVYSLIIKNQHHIKQTLTGMVVDFDQSIGMGMKFMVKETEPDGAMILAVHYTQTSYLQTGQEENIDYDSRYDPPPSSPEAQFYAALVGETFTVALADDGQVEKTRGLEGMISNIRQKISIPGMSREDLDKMIRQMADQAIKEWFAYFPDMPVGIGDTWKSELTLEGPLPMKVRNHWTLQAKLKDRLVLGLNSRMMPYKGKGVRLGGVDMTMDLAGTQVGSIEIDPKTGWTIRGFLKQELHGRVHAMRQTWPIEIIGDFSITGQTVN